ncbi:TPA: hypothetical protein N0F65_008772 [Lagenidium giganteum]|uniref:Uncharacterized protein n=1 Tax=Lagenidium giganteum TaxID=4803 RepID=A0AAV2YY80_9STRA|nr:TPA: hypothetical protein N0F65_008772 [Lagenidium giganteum]
MLVVVTSIAEVDTESTQLVARDPDADATVDIAVDATRHMPRRLANDENENKEEDPGLSMDEADRIEDQLNKALKSAIDKSKVQVGVATYRNAYGTRFAFPSVCYFISAGFLLLVAGMASLLYVVPVTPATGETSPFLLWFRTKKLDDEEEAEEENRRLSWARRPKKTYESIACETDDSLLVGLGGRFGDRVITIDDPDSLFDFPKREPKGIFAPVSPKRKVHIAGDEQGFFDDIPALRPASPSRSPKKSPRKSPIKKPQSPAVRRGTMRGGGETEEKSELLKEVERRASMAQRAEKRKEHAMKDITHENLQQEELQMYEYLEFVREFLEGAEIKKVCQQSARVVKRTFYLSQDLTTVYWNKVGNKKWLNKKKCLDMSHVDKVLKGFQGTRNVESKGKQEKSLLYVSVLTTDGKQLDLEAKDEAMRERLYIGFTKLASEKKEERLRRERGEPPLQQQPLQPPPPPPPEEETKPMLSKTKSVVDTAPRTRAMVRQAREERERAERGEEVVQEEEKQGEDDGSDYGLDD